MSRTATPKTRAQNAAEARNEKIKAARRQFRAEKAAAEDKLNAAMAEAWMEYSATNTNGSK